MKFTAIIELGGKTATGIGVPDEIVAALGSGKKPAVVVTIGSYSYRSTIASMGGRFMLPLSAEHRTKAGVAAGDEIEVDVELDLAPRELDVPDDLTRALATDSAAKSYFDGLSYSNRRRIVLSVEEAKTPETRQRRIDKAVAALAEGRQP
ncbi:YdeI/OmpD-associated family protein [Paenibacillus cymbidii]|uniref:YdeI/OmpD-associated family protein n=1 Tax=Paenibacillus cymbidii TaxID=1639034 RepID=UPI001080B9C4|nr:YdeI/OmpD-associated family protein [Paenibacillus cymbidii]